MGANNLKLAKKINECFQSSKYLNLPDLQFFNWCNERYKINRGIYNTIDQRLFDIGILSIYNRRIYLLAFLDYIKQNSQEKENHKFIKFGPGGLTNKLNEFISQYREVGNVVPLKKRS